MWGLVFTVCAFWDLLFKQYTRGLSHVFGFSLLFEHGAGGGSGSSRIPFYRVQF